MHERREALEVRAGRDLLDHHVEEVAAADACHRHQRHQEQPDRAGGPQPRRDEAVHRVDRHDLHGGQLVRSEEHTSELQSLMRISYAVLCLKNKNSNIETYTTDTNT